MLCRMLIGLLPAMVQRLLRPADEATSTNGLAAPPPEDAPVVLVFPPDEWQPQIRYAPAMASSNTLGKEEKKREVLRRPKWAGTRGRPGILKYTIRTFIEGPFPSF